MGKERTRKFGKLKKSTFKAKNNGKPNSTIFLIRSNITPTESDITVKAEIAKSIGGIIWPISHLSIRGIERQGAIILFVVFFTSCWIKIFKRGLLNFLLNFF